MTQVVNNLSIQEQFELILADENKMRMHEFLNNLNISDVALLIEEFEEQAAEIVAALSVHRAASTFKILELSAQKTIIQELQPLKTAALLNELPADDRTSFLEELPTSVVRELIKLLNPEERKITLSLLGYPEDSVGRLMTPDYIAVQADWTIAEVLEHIREVGQESETNKREKAFASFQVTESVMKDAAVGAIFMHCLPAHRGMEVSAEVIDGSRSKVIEQAHNRMHAARGLLAFLMGVNA